ncbi:MAG: beta-phosphoglucomutase [Caldilinea sp. CFX5]|nr:beta-phosphoglucomutase [Caldilinea sp. CFX5]
MSSRIQAILFDLDGVLTDTAEYHYQAWQWLADREGIPFDRTHNEQLRGVSRRESLLLLLGDRTIDEATAQRWMADKNRKYQELLQQITPADLLPGVTMLLDECDALGLRTAVVSASQNARFVLDQLTIADRFAVIVAGPEADVGPGKNRAKPAPDLFLLAAERLALAPANCLVVEDAAAGITAARVAGMATVGIGPVERVGHADLVLPDLNGVTVAQLRYAATWRVAEERFDPKTQNAWETIFTIGNGYLGTRGTLEEDSPGEKPATLIHGLWDDVPISYTELANAFDWTVIDLWVNGQPFRLNRGKVEDYCRWLDLRRGELHRSLRWTPPDGATVELHYTRLASLADQHALAVQLQVTPLVHAVDIRLRPRLMGHVENEGLLHWHNFEQGQVGGAVYLSGETRVTGKRLVQAMRLLCAADANETVLADSPGSPGLSLTTHVTAQTTVTLEKVVSVYTDRDTPDPLAAALGKVEESAGQGFTQLQYANAAAWQSFWAASDVIIEGDDEAQTAMRHALFQLRIAAPTHDERVSIGARSLSGFGYRGHVFWDTEIFVLPFFIFTQPHLARNLLMYRWHTLDGARRKAAGNGLAGAQYAWESAETGEEVTPRFVPGPRGEGLVRIWPGDIELHITVDVVYAIMQYWHITGDNQFMTSVGAPIVLETARFWESRVEPDKPTPGQFSISDVIGPDEYHDHINNNAFTNGMVRWHLQTAIAMIGWLESHEPAQAATLRTTLELTDERLAHWQTIAANLLFLRDPQRRLIEQFEGFFQLPEVDWPQYANRTTSMQALLGIEGANAHQVLKQPDVLMLLLLLDDQFTVEDMEVNWAYYSPRTDHEYGSSLGPAFHAWAACQLGQPEVAYAHFMRAARADLGDVRGNAADGIHIASSGGLWQAAVFGFAGLRVTDGTFTVQPNLPAHWRRLAFGVTIRGERHFVDLRND